MKNMNALVLAAVALCGFAAPLRAQTTMRQLQSAAGEPVDAEPQCRVESFSATLEGWTRDRDFGARVPCAVTPIEPQVTCTRAPCFNVACRAVIHYHAVVALAPGQTRLWPACYFLQERAGARAHNEGGTRSYDQLEAAPVQDHAGSVESMSVAFRKTPVAGRPGAYEVDFYDLPGWASAYWNGRPNATPPVYFPLDWHYMYRAYFGPKRAGFVDADFRYARVDMSAGVAPEPGVETRQNAADADEWNAFRRELGALKH